MSFGKLGAIGRGFGHLGALGTAGIPVPPTGFVFLVDDDGALLVDDDGAYLMEAV